MDGSFECSEDRGNPQIEETVEREGLLRFIPPLEQPVKVLAVESLFYLPELRRMLPKASINVVTIYEEAAGLPSYKALDIEWIFLDFRKDPLPFGEKTFDIILGEPCLTDAFMPYETLAELERRLTETGFLVTEFRNIRYWKVLEGLKRGVYGERARRLYAKPEVVRLLNDAAFKEISFAPLKRDPSGGEKWEALGFENFSDDLSTEAWMIKASRSTSAAIALKELYSPSVRRELSFLLHRIEYDVAREESFDRLRQLCRNENIFKDYLLDFAHEIVVHPEALRLIRARVCSG